MSETLLKDNLVEENKIFFKKYKIIKQIGNGSFSNIYAVERIKDKKKFALKAEKINSRIKLLESESFFLYTLQGFGIPKFITYGRTKNYNILIEELLGKNLDELFIKKKGKYNIIDICLIGIQLIDRFEWIHSKNIVYRDTKPENFLIGLENPNIIYIIDFGFCKKYRSSKTGKHVLPKNIHQFYGTIRFGSTNVLRGKQPSRRDDLISLGYMLIFFIKKKLPWDFNSPIFDKTKYLNALKIKESNANGQLFSNLPTEFSEYINYTRNLKFEQKPNYTYLKSLFLNIITKKNMDYNRITFSWIYFDNRILFGIPNNNSKRKNNSLNRIYNNIKEQAKVRLERELSQQHVCSIKPINNNTYSIDQISYKYISNRSSPKDTLNNINYKINIPKNVCRNNSASTLNSEVNNNIYLKSNSNDKKENLYKTSHKINNNRKNIFKYINSDEISDHENRKEYIPICKRIKINNKNKVINISNLFINQNFKRVFPMTEIPSNNNSNEDIFQSKDENKKQDRLNHYIFNYCPFSYDRNNNVVSTSNPITRAKRKLRSLISPIKKNLEINTNYNNMNKTNINQNNIINKTSPNVIKIKKNKLSKSISPNRCLDSNKHLNEKKGYKNNQTNNDFFRNNNIFHQNFQKNNNKRQILNQLFLENQNVTNI